MIKMLRDYEKARLKKSWIELFNTISYNKEKVEDYVDILFKDLEEIIKKKV